MFLGKIDNKRKWRNHLFNHHMKLIKYYAMKTWHVLGLLPFSKTKLDMFLGRIDNKRKQRNHLFNRHMKLIKYYTIKTLLEILLSY
uniref:Putative ovule protein n=1 Tax=Solanum chacoense TaxID=4108 RepID=A0A0V0H0G8_SOLCH